MKRNFTNNFFENTILLILVLIIVIALVFNIKNNGFNFSSGISSEIKKNKTVYSKPTISKPINGNLKSFTLIEVKKHNSSSDCLVILNKKVYNLTPLVFKILSSKLKNIKDVSDFCGKDDSRQLARFFPQNNPSSKNQINNFLNSFLVGIIN